METEEPGAWTIDDLHKLLHAMKQNITTRDTNSVYTKGLRLLEWEKVAFQPYSPEECRKKWQEISQKIRKIRSLTELIVEAEGAIDNPTMKTNYMILPGLLKKPIPPKSIFFKENCAKFQKQRPDLRSQDLFTFVNAKYKELPERKKAKYVKKSQLAHEEYAHRLLELREQHRTVKGTQHLSLKAFFKNPQTRQVLKTHFKREKFLQASPDEKEQHPEDPETSTVQPNPSLDSRELRSGSMPVKPPRNGYNLFCKEQWTSTSVSGKGFLTACAQIWRQLTQKQKDEYKMRCKQLMREYKIKLHQYQPGKEQLVRNATKIPMVKSISTFLGEPKMPSRSGNVVFCGEQMKVMKIPDTKERMAKISPMWRTLSVNLKKNYNKIAEENMRKYTVELQTWFKTLTAEEQADYRKQKPYKCKFLDVKQKKTPLQERPGTYRPSDSEDENIEDSSSSDEDDEEEEEEDSDFEGEEEEEDLIMFGMY